MSEKDTKILELIDIEGFSEETENMEGLDLSSNMNDDGFPAEDKKLNSDNEKIDIEKKEKEEEKAEKITSAEDKDKNEENGLGILDKEEEYNVMIERMSIASPFDKDETERIVDTLISLKNKASVSRTVLAQTDSRMHTDEYKMVLSSFFSKQEDVLCEILTDDLLKEDKNKERRELFKIYSDMKLLDFVKSSLRKESIQEAKDKSVVFDQKKIISAAYKSTSLISPIVDVIKESIVEKSDREVIDLLVKDALDFDLYAEDLYVFFDF